MSCCYIPPDGEKWKLDYVFSGHSHCEIYRWEKKEFYCIADFNLNCLVYHENDKIRDFYNNIFEKGVIPIINRPTRVTDHSATLIDNIIKTEFLNESLKKGIIKTDVSDHFPIFFSLNISSKKFTEKNKKKKKNLIRRCFVNIESDVEFRRFGSCLFHSLTQ